MSVGAYEKYVCAYGCMRACVYARYTIREHFRQKIRNTNDNIML